MLFHPALAFPLLSNAGCRGLIPLPRPGGSRFWGGICRAGTVAARGGLMWPLMMPVPGAVPAPVRGERRPPLRNHEALPALCSRGSAAAPPRGPGGLSPPGRQQEPFPPAGCHGELLGAVVLRAALPEGARPDPARRRVSGRCSFPLPGAGRCRGRRLRLPRGAGEGGGVGRDAGSGSARWPLGGPGIPGGRRRREPPGSVRSGLMRFPGSPAPRPGVFPAGDARRRLGFF